MPDPSSSDIYSVEHADVERVFAAIPDAHRRKPRELKWLIRGALAEICQHGLGDNICREDSIAYLISQIRSYCRSGEVRDLYFRELTTWLRDGGWDEPKSAWVSRKNRAEKAVIDSQDRWAEEQRRKFKLRMQE